MSQSPPNRRSWASVAATAASTSRAVSVPVPILQKYPDENSHHNKFAEGRPRLKNISSRWPISGNGANPLPAQPFENKNGWCYRNAIVHTLMNTPIFVNWLSRHNSTDCVNFRRDCLRCGAQALAQQYFNVGTHDQQALSEKLTEFWDLCQKVFWGIRAQRKKAGGPRDINKGWYALPFLKWLVKSFQEQCHREPSDVQVLERMFSMQTQRRIECHKSGCNYHSGWGLNREEENIPLSTPSRATTTSLDKAVARHFSCETTDDHASHFGTQNANLKPECPRCGETHLKTYTYIVNAPEVVVLNVERSRKDDQSYWHDIPLTENLSLTNYSISKQPLNYRLNSACIYPGKLFGQDEGHVFNLIRGRDGHWYRVNDSVVDKLSSWQVFDARQRGSWKPEARYMPVILFYVRETDESLEQRLTRGKRSSTSDDTSPQQARKRLKRSPSPSAIDDDFSKTAPFISLGFTESIGDAIFSTRVTVRPSDGAQDSTPDSIQLAESCTYELSGKKWEGSLVGNIKPRDVHKPTAPLIPVKGPQIQAAVPLPYLLEIIDAIPDRGESITEGELIRLFPLALTTPDRRRQFLERVRCVADEVKTRFTTRYVRRIPPAGHATGEAYLRHLRDMSQAQIDSNPTRAQRDNELRRFLGVA